MKRKSFSKIKSLILIVNMYFHILKLCTPKLKAPQPFFKQYFKRCFGRFWDDLNLEQIVKLSTLFKAVLNQWSFRIKVALILVSWAIKKKYQLFKNWKMVIVRRRKSYCSESMVSGT